MNVPAKVAVFISGGGTNLQALIDACKEGRLAARILLVVSSRSDAYGIERAHREGIATFVHKAKNYATPEEAAQALLGILEKYEIEYIALAGYMKLVPVEIIRKYNRRIVNIHPALLPKYGGKGMYGHFVHEAVLASGDKESGATVHIVDEIYDNGRILLQKKVPVYNNDTPDSLAERVLEVEHEIYSQALDNLIKGNIK
jgi:phosphoribosylglycinamide formyltransferase 1